ATDPDHHTVRAGASRAAPGGGRSSGAEPGRGGGDRLSGVAGRGPVAGVLVGAPTRAGRTGPTGGRREWAAVHCGRRPPRPAGSRFSTVLHVLSLHNVYYTHVPGMDRAA